jgi:hypothetical protein
LISPLVWQGPLITILPSSLSELLQSPIPLITGMKELPPSQEGWNDPLIINLNSKSNPITLPKEKFPSLPDFKSLFNEIKFQQEVLISPTQGNSNPLRRCTDQERIAVDSIMVSFRRYNTWLLDNEFLPSDNLESSKQLLSQLPKSQQEFFRQLVMTQQYSVHALQLQCDLEVHSLTMGATLHKLDQMIAVTSQERADLISKIQDLNDSLQRADSRLAALKASRMRLLHDDSGSNLESPKRRAGHRRNKSWLR